MHSDLLEISSRYATDKHAARFSILFYNHLHFMYELIYSRSRFYEAA